MSFGDFLNCSAFVLKGYKKKTITVKIFNKCDKAIPFFIVNSLIVLTIHCFKIFFENLVLEGKQNRPVPFRINNYAA